MRKDQKQCIYNSQRDQVKDNKSIRVYVRYGGGEGRGVTTEEKEKEEKDWEEELQKEEEAYCMQRTTAVERQQ